MPSLLRQLEDLGDSLITADVPVDARKILGAVVHYLETGSLEPVAPPPSAAQVTQVDEAEAENERLKARIAELESPAPPPSVAASVPEPTAPNSPGAGSPAAGGPVVPPAEPSPTPGGEGANPPPAEIS